MEQQKKEGLIGDILKALIIQFGIPLLDKVLNKHKEEVKADGPQCPTGYYWDDTNSSCVKNVG